MRYHVRLYTSNTTLEQLEGVPRRSKGGKLNVKLHILKKSNHQYHKK